MEQGKELKFFKEAKPKVTVIVTVYNSAKYLRQCLQSLQNQTLSKSNLEVLIINDGSTDDSKSIIQDFLENNKNFRLIDEDNKGLFAARKVGLENAKGNYIGWVDSDDFISPLMYETLLRVAENGKSDLVYCNYSFYPRKINTKEKWFREYKGQKNVNYIERNSQPWNKLVSIDLLKKLKIGDLFLTCYDEAYIKCLLYAKRPISVNKSFYYYRVGGDSMSSSYNNVEHYTNFIKSSKALKKEMSVLCKKSKYWKEYFDYRILYYELITLIVAAYSNDKMTFNKLKNCRRKFHNNIHFRKIMITNYGVIKYLVMTKVVPINFHVAKVICKVGFSKN